MQKDFSEDIGHSSVLENKISGMERTPKNLKTWDNVADLIIEYFREGGHTDIPRYQCVQPRNLEEERRKM